MVKMRDLGARVVIVIRPLGLQDVYLYWRLLYKFENVDLLLVEMDLWVIARRYSFWNTPEEGIIRPLGIVIWRGIG